MFNVDEEALAEKTYVYIKNGVKVLSIMGLPKEIEYIEIPLEFLYKKMKWEGWFKYDLSLDQRIKLKDAIKLAFKEAEETLPTHKRDLLNRARIAVSNWLSENPSELISLDREEKLTNILKQPIITEGEFLTENDFNKLTRSFLEILMKKLDDPVFSNKFNRERIEVVLEFVTKELNELQNQVLELSEQVYDHKEHFDNRMSVLENEKNYNSSVRHHGNKVKTDNELYANNFEEVLFLHKNSKNQIRLCDGIFVFHKYQNIPHHDYNVPHANTYSIENVIDYIRNFINSDLNFPKGSLMPDCLFIEGDAGLGKSSLVSYLAYKYTNDMTVKQDIFGDRELICVRLRDIIPDSMRFDGDSINKNILKHLNVTSHEELKSQHCGAVIILDGFDELCMIERINANANRCIYDLCKLFGGCKLIITTRPKYLNINGLDFFKVHIILQHFDKSQREEWVAKYRDKSSDPDEEVALNYIENIDDDAAIGICDTPMALYMMAAGKINEDAKKNHWAMYHQIFYKELSETEYNSMFPSKDGLYHHPIIIHKELIYRISAEIAFEMYKTGNSKLYLNEDEISKIIDNHLSNSDLRELIECCYALCSYWKATGKKGVAEFYHNNIRDFFMCEKIFYEMNKFYEEWESLCYFEMSEAIIERLYTLFHYSRLDAKVIEFLYLRTLYEMEKNVNNFAKEEQKRKFLPHFFQLMLRGNGIFEPESHWNVAYNSVLRVLENTVQVYRSAYEPFLTEESKIHWLGYNEIRYISAPFFINHFKQLFIRAPLTIDNKIIYTAGRADFDGINLKGADLRFAGFIKCTMCEANLSNTALQSVDFQGSCLCGTDFSGADLRHTNFIDCDLKSVILPDGFTSKDSREVEEHLKNLSIDGLRI